MCGRKGGISLNNMNFFQLVQYYLVEHQSTSIYENQKRYWLSESQPTGRCTLQPVWKSGFNSWAKKGYREMGGCHSCSAMCLYCSCLSHGYAVWIFCSFGIVRFKIGNKNGDISKPTKFKLSPSYNLILSIILNKYILYISLLFFLTL